MLLRGDVHAAGAPRRLLWRSRIRRGTRGADAVGTARMRHHQPACIRLDFDRIGGLRTLLIGSSMQCFALFLFLPFDGLASLFVISALFGLFQGGIVPSYAI